MHSEMTGNPRTGLMTLVNQVYKAMNKRASEELLGMRLKQFLTLSYIQDHENVTQQELETTLLVDANAVVLLLNDLETAGYVVRRRDPADRRRHLVEVTRAGKAALERADKARIALADFLGRVKGFELTSAEPWEPRKALHVHGPARLPIRFERC